MDKIKRATEIYRTMTPHQMALMIVELEDIAEIVGQLASDRSKRITELQGAPELEEEAVRAKQQPEALDGWLFVPVEPTSLMIENSGIRGRFAREIWSDMLAAAPKPQGGTV